MSENPLDRIRRALEKHEIEKLDRRRKYLIGKRASVSVKLIDDEGVPIEGFDYIPSSNKFIDALKVYAQIANSLNIGISEDAKEYLKGSE